MKKLKKISIIVPVYNVEKYLSKCLDSLVNQSLDDIEIICINDGSKDNSLSILNKYKNEYPNKIIIIDKQNEGVWKARVDGVKKSNSEYIGFVDSDDYVNYDYALKLYSNAIRNDSDIVICGFDRIDLDTQKLYSREMLRTNKYNFEIQKNPGRLLEINGAPWNKIYKSSLLKNMYKLNTIPRVLDDMMFLQLIYINANKVTFVNESLIYYMVRKDSIINTVKKELLPDVYTSMIEIRNLYKKENKKMLDYVDANAFLHLGISLMYRLSEDETLNIKECIKDNTKFLKKNFKRYNKTKYIKLPYIINNYGINFKLWIVKIFYDLGLFTLFLNVYKFMIKKLKIDIKW